MIPKEAARYMVAEINAAELPNELLDIGAGGQVTRPFGRHDELAELLSPMLFELRGVGSDLSVDVIQLEQRRCHRTTAAQAGPARPAKPKIHDGGKPRQSLCRLHGRIDHDATGGLRHFIEEFDL